MDLALVCETGSLAAAAAGGGNQLWGVSVSCGVVTHSDVCPAEVAQGEEEIRNERRDAEAMLQAQALHEEEEELYYQGAEKAVKEHVEGQESRRCQDCDDWAMFDEMHGAGTHSRGRKRLCLDVTVGPQMGEAGAAPLTAE